MAEESKGLSVLPLPGMPMVQPGDDLAALVNAALQRNGLDLRDGDVLVIAQKVVSKSEGRSVLLSTVTPSDKAMELAVQVDKDPRLVELILRDSTQIIRAVTGVLIVRHQLGFVCANAGIDQSNIEHDDGERAMLLPLDPDDSARRIRDGLCAASGKRLGVIICDSVNRPWRLGTIGMAIGCSGVKVLDDRRGDTDIFGRTLKITMSNRADSIASAALLIMGETDEGIPVVLVRGLPFEDVQHTARDAVRPREEDLFL